MDNYALNNGVLMPVVGLGTYPMNRFVLIKTIMKAVKYGYTSFDTASAYGNEKSVGYGIKLCSKKRTDIFITTKLSNFQQRSGEIEQALKNSLKLLKVSYVDLYLMHWPNPDTFLRSWVEMEKLYKKGLARAIGVCNFHQHHLEKLMEIANVMPTINQVELHPLLTQKNLTEFCLKNNIRVQAYSPLARMNDKLICNDKLLTIAQKYRKSVTQVILRWDYQNGIITVPKTQNYGRLKDNINIFDFRLSKDEINVIDDINIDFRIRHNPDNCDFTKL